MEKIKSFIRDYASNNVLFVLKGYDIADLGIPRSNLCDYIENSKTKMHRITEIVNQDVPVISFEELVLFFNTLTDVFDRIYILENGVYYHLWPLGVKLSEEVMEGLLVHYDRDADDNFDLNEISQYTEIYSNFLKIDGKIVCNFNLRNESLSDPKIEVRRFVDDKGEHFASFLEGAVFHNICDQEDYIRLIFKLQQNEEKYCISVDNFVDSISELKLHIEFLAGVYPNRIAYLRAKHDSHSDKICTDEIYSIMKQYWGYDSFRTLKVYDMECLQEQKKKIKVISQENIISDIIEQAENCMGKYTRDNIRDIFVTASTGAGKSLMFQLPAMYLAQKYKLLTIVVSPLIALMEDQVKNLERKGYYRSATINSDKPPIIKQEIYRKIMDNEIDLLYLSPESLLSRSDIEQLIGKRKIGLFVVDEAHIVTTWGKQFRPDYWFLGDHVNKLRRKQMAEEDGFPFVITTFTATAIYGGIEDMYHETLNSLHMVDPITYLGNVRRQNISIDVSAVEKISAKEEYEVNKFDEIYKIADTALLRGQKVLVYFPTVALIERCRAYFAVKHFNEVVTYYGSLPADKKNENIEAFRSGDKLVMLATKAFGMGVDIPDITIVAHFAPTGNVCDYMQEIGRAARDKAIDGHAVYKHMSNDFKHINRLHGMSTIRNYQLAGVIGKILDLYTEMRYSATTPRQKKRNSMLIDANSFAYIFDDGGSFDDGDIINKVKTAMLLIQKDYERQGFAPFHMRPIPIFAYGYFSGNDEDMSVLKHSFPNAAKLIYPKEKIYEINLEAIWESAYQSKYSFPQFKYLLYSCDPELDINRKIHLNHALKIEVELYNNPKDEMERCLGIFMQSIKEPILKNTFIKKSDLIERIAVNGKFSKYAAENLTNVIMAAADVYRRDISPRLNSRLYSSREMHDGEYNLSESYRFSSEMNDFFSWLKISFHRICREVVDGTMYIVEKNGEKKAKETITCLGVFEAMKVLQFKTIGGLNSQLYIYVNETRQMQIVKSRPERYKNRLLELVNNRHVASVQMMTFLFQSGFTSEEIWDRLEDYFLGIVPKDFEQNIEITSADEVLVAFVPGDDVQSDYHSWKELNTIFNEPMFSQLDECCIPLPDFISSVIHVGDQVIDCCLTWEKLKVALMLSPISDVVSTAAVSAGWNLYELSKINVDLLKSALKGE